MDLDSILAHEYISSQDKANRGLTLPTLAHLSASVLLKKIYGKILDFEFHHTTFRSLMSLMRSRSTAWEKDRLKIAMLLSRHDGGSDFDPSHTVPELTRRLLTRLGSIPITAAFHGESPMSQHGPWSWCPSSVFGLDNSGRSFQLSENDQEFVKITAQGFLEGFFYCFYAGPSDANLCTLLVHTHKPLLEFNEL